MKRYFYQELVEWKQSKERKPLIVQGARQVGKTYLLKEFGSKEFENFCYLNFEDDRKLSSLFIPDKKPKRILEAIRLYQETQISENTLLIFDEVQECPEALNSLKYFQEESPHIPIVAAGSLLGIKLKRGAGFPVGKVHFSMLYPMCFWEFLEALGQESLVNYLRGQEKPIPIPEALHLKLLEYLKQYFCVGGMPEAVRKFVENPDWQQIRTIQKDILKAYLLDFAKHAEPQQVMKITSVWQSLPQQLAKESKKFVFKVVDEKARAREYEIAIQWLVDAGLVYRLPAVSVPKLPLSGYLESQYFKLYALDVGLLVAISELSPKVLLEGNQLFMEFKGALSENFVAEELILQGHALYYWRSGNQAEVDFVTQVENDIYPIEVKAGVSRKGKSLSLYGERFHPPVLTVVSSQNWRRDGDVLNVPFYLLKKFP